MAKYSDTLEPGAVLDVTLSLDTSIYADNDVLAAPQEVTNFFRTPGGRTRINSILLLDKDDQGTEVELVFLNATGSIGAENAVYAPTDAVADTIIANHLFATFHDANTSQYAFVGNLRYDVKAAAGTTSAWVGAVVRSGTPTYTAAGITLKIGVTYLT